MAVLKNLLLPNFIPISTLKGSNFDYWSIKASLMKLLIVFIHFYFMISYTATSQTISDHIPNDIQKSERYLFYLHGGVVTLFGNNAINQSMPEWGPYEYLNILDTLRSRGFNVISENRKEGIEDMFYVNRIVRQIDTLVKAGVKKRNILVVGASAGWHITLNVSAKIKNRKLNYVMMGGCWPDSYKEYVNLKLRGHFLSIIETSDPHGTCAEVFRNQKRLKSYREITLNTGLSHGFIYKGYPAWIDPIIKWLEER